MLHIRPATAADSALISQMIIELSEYEKLRHECFADEALLTKHLFGTQPKAHALIAEWNGAPAAFALYFYNFSTFLCKPGIYLEDLFVRPDFRRKGIANALFQRLAQIAVAEECGRLEWSVLDWNEDALKFYASLGAVSMSEWIGQRLEGEALANLAK